MDHKALVARIPPHMRAQLLARSNWAGAGHLAAHWGLLALMSALIILRVPYWGMLLPVQGVVLIFNFTLLHECTHKTPFRTLWINEAVGWACGLLVGLPFWWFRYFHMAHHKHTNDPKRDPELAAGGRPDRVFSYFWHVTGLPVWKSQFATLINNAMGQNDDNFMPTGMRLKIQVESVIILLVYIVAIVYSCLSTTLLIWIWLLPALLGQPFLRLYLLAEHGKCPAVANMLENSRTTFTNRAVRFLAWNMPYHAEHHSFPMVPFFRLPQLHAHAKPHLVTTENGYAKFTAKFASDLRL